MTYETNRRWKGVCEARGRRETRERLLVWRSPSRAATSLSLPRLFGVQIRELEAAERTELADALMRRVLRVRASVSAAVRGEGTGGGVTTRLVHDEAHISVCTARENAKRAK